MAKCARSTDMATLVSPALPTPQSPGSSTSGRLLSLDALRGFDMFWIVGAEDIVHALRKLSDSGPVRLLAEQMDHKAWAGFAFYDLIFPMFVFIVGVSLVFSLGRLVEREGRAEAMWRIGRRALLLYIIGIFYYGGFSASFERIRLLGVLQRIALCYLFAGLAFVYLKPRGLLALLVGVLGGYWALMTFVPVPGIGAGNFAEGQNLANWIDKQYLPLRRWDGDHDPEGILSTLPAIGTCLLGVFAGLLMQRKDLSDRHKVRTLALAGLGLVAAGWLWHLQFPVIKKIWTSSYVLVAAGYSSLFFAVFHYAIEVRQWRRWAEPFVWIGLNPITVYLLHNLVDLNALAKRFVGGDLGQLAFGAAQPLVATVVVMLTSIGFCWWLHRRRIYLRL